MDYTEIEVNGVPLAVYQKGEGETTLMFIHGNSLNANTFEKQFNSSLSDRFKLVAFDLPGHGNSGKAVSPEDTYSLLGYAGLLQSLIAKLQLANLYLIGHSLGGHIALETSSELGEELRGVAILGTPPLGVPPDMANAFLPNPAMALAFQGELSTEEAESLAKVFVQGNPPNSIVQSILQTDPNARTFMATSIGQGKMKDELSILKKANVPIAILQGEHDALANTDYISTLDIPTLWRGELQVISDSGHSSQLEKADAFNNLVQEFAG